MATTSNAIAASNLKAIEILKDTLADVLKLSADKQPSRTELLTRLARDLLPKATGTAVSKKSGLPLMIAAAEALKVPKPKRNLAYGTAGFRMDASLLDSTCLRMGMLAVLRSLRVAAPVGIMVTASHNGPKDNGLKVADADGGMMVASWEKHATALANAEDDKVAEVLESIAKETGIQTALYSCSQLEATVFLGRDTRDSSPALSNLVKLGVESLGGKVIDIGIVSTPQLHHVVYSYNRGEAKWASVAGYSDKVESAFRRLLATAPAGTPRSKTCPPLLIDCANGVGSHAIQTLAGNLRDVQPIELRNVAGSGPLNSGCGAEHVQKKRLPPKSGVSPMTDQGVRIASFDGDADRVVFLYFDEAGRFQLLDGDKIAVLTADFLNANLKAAGLDQKVSLGIVQTAYANGAAHAAVLAKGIKCPYAKTGVKYCHHKALDFQIGIYYEANGHGTAMFKDEVVELFEAEQVALSGAAAASLPDTAAKLVAIERLLASAQLYNQAVGDAICDALFVEAVLYINGQSIMDWAKIYTDLPSRQTKVRVKDRKVVVPMADETAVVRPAALRDAIAAAASKMPSGRAFARPSGTEDVVRVYAEADTEANADKLAFEVAMAIFTHAGGLPDHKPEMGKWA